jgi:RNA polymerase sigma-70 factor (ECF subfamily)
MFVPASDIGEHEARARFDECFRAHYADVLAYGLRRLGDRAAAADVASETFVVAWRHRDALPDEVLPWLFGVARHVLLNERRAARRRERLDARLGGERRVSADDPADIVAERAAILAAFGRLSEPEREALRLVAWDGLGRDQAAAALGCSRNAYAIRLYRARRRLARYQAADPSPNVQPRPPRAAEIAEDNPS